MSNTTISPDVYDAVTKSVVNDIFKSYYTGVQIATDTDLITGYVSMFNTRTVTVKIDGAGFTTFKYPTRKSIADVDANSNSVLTTDGTLWSKLAR